MINFLYYLLIKVVFSSFLTTLVPLLKNHTLQVKTSYFILILKHEFKTTVHYTKTQLLRTVFHICTCICYVLSKLTHLNLHTMLKSTFITKQSKIKNKK